MISSVSTLKRRGQYKLCNDFLQDKEYDEQTCKNEFLDKQGSYAMRYVKSDSRSKCHQLKYKLDCTIGSNTLGDEVTNIMHKS